MMGMLDPFGFWKTYRESTLDASSKLMIDAVNTEDYAKFTGAFLDQYLSMTQPIQDAVQKYMVFSLAFLNMPTREEVLSVAERLVHIETRLDDLDAETYDMHHEDNEALRATERRIDSLESKVAASGETVTKELRDVEQNLAKVLNTIMARLDKLEIAVAKGRNETPARPQPRPQPRAEAKPAAKPEPKSEIKK